MPKVTSELLSPAPVPTLTKSNLDTETIVNNNSPLVIGQQRLQHELIREEIITQKNAYLEDKRTSTDSVTSNQTTDTTSSQESANDVYDDAPETMETQTSELTSTTPEAPVEIRVASPGVVEMTLKRRSFIGSDEDDLLDPGIHAQNDAAEELHIETNDPSHLFWVPAHLHPEIAPNEFRKWLQNHAKDGFNAGPGSLRRRKSALSHQYIPPENGDVEVEETSRVIAKAAKGNEENEKPIDEFDWESYGASDGSISPTAESSKLNILRRSLSLNLPPFMETSIFDQFSSPKVDSDVLVPRMAPALKRAARTKIRRNSVAGERGNHRFSAHRRTKSTHIAGKPKQTIPGATASSLPHKLSQSNNDVKFKIVINNGEGASVENEEKDIELTRSSVKRDSDLVRITLKDDGNKYNNNNETVKTEPRRTSSLSPGAIEVNDTLQDGRIPITEQAKTSLSMGILSKKIISGKISPTLPNETTTATNTHLIKRSPSWTAWLPWTGGNGGNSEEKETRTKKSSKLKEKIDRDAKIEKEVKFVDNKQIKEVENNSLDPQEIKNEDDDDENLVAELESNTSNETIIKEKSKISLSSLFSWNSTSKTKIPEDAVPSGTTATSISAAVTAASTVQVVNKKPKYTNYNRLPIHMERAIYRLSHVKLANPRRPLHEQVLISNMMFWYLSLINKQQAEYGGNHPQADKEAKKVKSKVGKERGGKRQKRNKQQAGQARRGSEIAYKAPQYDMQQAQISQYLSPPSSPTQGDGELSTSLINEDSADENSDCESDEEFPAHTYHHYNNGYTSDGTDGGHLEDSNYKIKKKTSVDLPGTSIIINEQRGNVENNGKINSNEESANGSKNINDSNYKRPPSPNTHPTSNAGRPVSPNGKPKSLNGRSVSPSSSNSASRRATNLRPINSTTRAKSPSAGPLFVAGGNTGG
ncbi:11099_t:CDS:2, partial [Ambispora leptoticha]